MFGENTRYQNPLNFAEIENKWSYSKIYTENEEDQY